MPAKRDLTGQKFGRLLVLKEMPERKNNSVVWHCLCDCGNECDVVSPSLIKGRTKSCGCWKKESDRMPKNNVIEMVGKKFGHLTVISRAGSDNRGEAKWECECDCPSHPHIIVLGSNLRSGHTQSCGCERRSHGEIVVEDLLIKNNIPYIREYQAFKFNNNHWAKFDFYVNNKYFIEYDGETHFQSNLHGWHTEDRLQAQQERDMIKNQWCIDNDIPLIRIPYIHLNDLTIDDLKLETSNFIINS